MAKDIMKTQACITGIITADENDVKQLQLHTHTQGASKVNMQVRGS